MRIPPRLLLLVLALLLTAAPVGGDSFREEFDEPGAEPLVPTRFSVGFFIGNSTVERGPIAPGQGAPATGGVLPVDEGGDFELRFFAPMTPAGSGYARTPETGFGDVELDGYIALGNLTTGTLTAHLLVRVGGTTVATLNAYGVGLRRNSPTTGRLTLLRFTNGIGQAAMASSDPFPVTTASENYHVFLRAIGDTLTAFVLRVEDVDGVAVETPIDLDDAAGLQTELTAVTDGELTSGGLGMRAFAINGNSSFFDDVTVLDMVFTDGFESGDTMAWTLAVP